MSIKIAQAAVINIVIILLMCKTSTQSMHAHSKHACNQDTLHFKIKN